MISPSGILLVAGLVIGHAAVSVGFLNRCHSLGFDPKWMNRIALAPLVIPAVVAVWCTWILVTRGLSQTDLQSNLFLVYLTICNAIAWIVLPVTTIAQRFRRRPRHVTGRIETVRLELSRPSQSLIGEGKHSWMLRLPGNESLMLQVATWNIRLSSLAPEFTPLRILHLSDLHFAPCYTVDYFEAVADAAAGWEADLVCFTGDLLDDLTTLDWTVPVFSKLRGRLGQFAILGNHDVEHRPGRVRRALRSAGFTMIDGRWLRVEHDNRWISLGGTSAPWGPKLDPADRPNADVTIVMSHSPDQFPALAEWRTVDLVLAGHNHGGQIRLPSIGAVVTPSRFGRRYDRGIFQRRETLMEVTQGVGGKHPLRYGCRPEVVQIVLQPSPGTGTQVMRNAVRIDDSAS